MDLHFRRAVLADLPTIIAMLADDQLGGTIEDLGPPLDPRYAAAFAAIESDPNQLLLVATNKDAVVASLQLIFLRGLSRKGMLEGLVKAVRVSRPLRGAGIRGALLRHAIDECRARGCEVVQLTTNKARTDAHRFYTRLGFAATHEGFKMRL
jgi:GNAT superfamily N-acetyltransferase